MDDWYARIKLVHVAAVMASGALFLFRGIAIQAGAGWGMAAPLRYLSYTIDVVLLAAALVLLAILPSAAYANGWLAVKLALLVIYIGLGSFALKRGRTARIRALTFVGALFVYAGMYLIARTHDPAGPWKLLLAMLA